MTSIPTPLKKAMQSLGMVRGEEYGMYAPLVKRHPIRIDDELPADIKARLIAHHTCACTNEQVVYIDTELAADMFKRAAGDKADDSDHLEEMETPNYATMLVHEYTHILMKHVEKGLKFVRANGEENYPIFALACDIEANRGYRIPKWSDLYSIGVTEDSYPECRGVEGLMNIYRVLKANYGKEIKRNFNEADADQSEGTNNATEEDSQAQPSSSQASDGDGGGEGEGEGERGSESEREARAKEIREAMSGLKQLREEIRKLEGRINPEEFDENLEQYSDAGKTPMSETMGGGAEEDPDGIFSGTPAKELPKIYDKYCAKQLERVTQTLKGFVSGSQIRERTKSYSRPSRRDSDDGLIRKGVKNKKNLAPKILVAMDSSGSMDGTEVTPIAAAIGTIAKTLGKTRGSWICEHDSNVRNLRPLSEWEAVVNGYEPYGDNDFDEVLAVALKKKVDLVLNVGDGYSGFFDTELMKSAKAAGIRWVDVQVCGSRSELEHMIQCDVRRFGENFMGREIISLSV